MADENRLPARSLVGYALGDLGGVITFTLMGSFLTPFYTEVAGLSTGAVALIYLVIRIWDAVNDPMMGALMDKVFARTHSAKGKFRPWMIRSAPLLAISAILMFTAPAYIDGIAKVVATIVIYLIYEASYTMFNIPYGSMLSVMANTDKERASLSSARGLGSLIGNVIPLMIFPLILSASESNPLLGYAGGATICAVLGLIACLLSCYWTAERNSNEIKEAPEDASQIKVSDILVVFRKNRPYNALCIQGLVFCLMQYIGNTLLIYMFRDVLGALPLMSLQTVLMVPLGLAGIAVLPSISGRFGLERTVRVSQLLAGILYLILFFLPSNAYLFLIFYTVASLMGQVTVLMQWGMVGEAIDYNEYVTGKRTEGSMYGTFSLMRRIGQALGSSLAVAMLGAVGYVPGAEVQTSSVLLWIKILLCLLSAFLFLLMYLNLKFVWNMTPEIREKISGVKA